MRWHPKACKHCGRKATQRTKISARGLCPKCAALRVKEGLTQMSEGTGPVADKWAEGIIKGARRRAGLSS